MPFVKVFIKIVFNAAPVINQQVDLKVSSDLVTSLIGLTNFIQSD